ncbi:MAG: hypothetical protein ACFB4I_17435 [Cyanophyceae cyanobacterium]
MKLRSTAVLTSILLVMMAGAGALSAMMGYTLGHEALKSVSQPKIDPMRASWQKTEGKAKKFTVVPEKEILVKVYDQIHGKKTSPPAQEIKEVKDETRSFIKSSEPPESKFPLQAEDSGVVLEIVETNQQRGSLQLQVSLANNSEETVQFLYSFMEVKDDNERALGVIADGLPGELPPTGQKFLGTVSIPLALLEDTEQLSLLLTDYPNQNIRLNIPKIPVKR